jgi:hypothetical protein
MKLATNEQITAIVDAGIAVAASVEGDGFILRRVKSGLEDDPKDVRTGLKAMADIVNCKWVDKTTGEEFVFVE